MTENTFDYLVIGGGMSGLAASIRLGMYDQSVVLLESHRTFGGLNSYYQRVKKDAQGKRAGLRFFDVGLHALTNFADKKAKKKPLNKCLRQLRIAYDELKLEEQTYSSVIFDDEFINFTNSIEVMSSQVAEKFPQDHEAFQNLVELAKSDIGLDLNLPFQSTLEKLEQMFSSPLLREMILCPVQYYGCAWERDMDWGQFLIMFQSLFLEGFSRPQGGVRTLIKILEDKMRALEIPYSLGEGVEQIQKTDDGFVVQTTKNRTLKVKKIFSSAGHLETLNLVQGFELKTKVNPGPLSFTEVLLVYPQKILKPLVEQTIVFFNQGKTFDYLKPNDFFDAQSGVICFPDNYHQEDREGEGMVRLTFKANFEKWNQLSKSEYNEMKTKVLIAAKKIIQQYFPQITETPLFEDIFTPLTIKKFTSHIDGAVYGSTDKERNGKTTVPNLYLIGTDQGYLGIVGAMLSGISMANLYGLQGES